MKILIAGHWVARASIDAIGPLDSDGCRNWFNVFVRGVKIQVTDKSLAALETSRNALLDTWLGTEYLTLP
jgi:hypothetical protein